MKFLTVFVFVMVAGSISASNLSWGRIGGGGDAGGTKGNFIVMISKDDEFICAGSIIFAHWVLTTAHCLAKENITITAGSNNPSPMARQSEPGVQSRLVTSKNFYIVHPNYSNDSDSENIGLVYVENPFNLTISGQVSKIGLPTATHKPKTGEVFGWGQTRYHLKASTLQVASVSNVKDNHLCNILFQSHTPLHPFQMCSHGFSRPCLHDDGGPLVENTSSGRKLVGIINWLAGNQNPQNAVLESCSNRNVPTLYTSVPYFVWWIIDSIIEFVPPKY